MRCWRRQVQSPWSCGSIGPCVCWLVLWYLPSSGDEAVHFHGGTRCHLIPALHLRDEKTEVQRRERLLAHAQSQEAAELGGSPGWGGLFIALRCR